MGDQRKGLGEIVGNEAHDAADSGNPLKVGGKASSGIPGVVGADDRVNAYFDIRGLQHIAIEDAAGQDRAANVSAANELGIGGGLGHDDVDAGSNPIKIGGRASASLPASVGDGDRVNAYFDQQGRQLARLSVPLIPDGNELAQREDVAAASGDPGIQVLTHRRATPSGSAGSAGDYQALETDTEGKLWVRMYAEISPGVKDLIQIEDLPAPAGCAGIQTLSIRRASPTGSAGTEGDWQSLESSGAGELYVTQRANVTPGATAMLQREDNASVAGAAGIQVLTIRKSSPASSAGSNEDWAALITDALGQLFTVEQAQTLGGYDVERLLSAATVNATVAKASPGQVYGWYMSNTNAAVRYVKLYNKATSPAETDTPLMTIAVPGNTAGAGTNVSFPHGIEFGTGIGFRTTTGYPDANTGAVAAGEIIINLLYK